MNANSGKGMSEDSKVYLDIFISFNGAGTDSYVLPVGVWRIIPYYLKNPTGLVFTNYLQIYDNDGIKLCQFDNGTNAGYYYILEQDILWTYHEVSLGIPVIADGTNAAIKLTQNNSQAKLLAIKIG